MLKKIYEQKISSNYRKSHFLFIFKLIKNWSYTVSPGGFLSFWKKASHPNPFNNCN